MENHQTLKEFSATHSQKAIAEMMDVSQGAISQMLKSGRDIRVVEDSSVEAGFRFYEVRPLSNRSKAA
ncbi:hypothetical protein R84981_000956 [Carnimonas sp. R-84981]|uniref:hypothetical protein n=1 Tax=Carnimonas bestiolae TaxID=3402172 RepID=UPI003EDC7DD7